MRPAFVLPAVFVAVAALDSGGVPESAASLLAAIVLLALATAAVLAEAPGPPAVAVVVAAGVFLTLLSALWGQPGDALRVAPLWALYAGLGWGASWCARSASTLPPLRVATLAVAVAALVAGVARLAGAGGGPARLHWPIGYADGLGLVCAFAVLLCVGVRPAWPVGAVVAALATILTASRSAVAGLLVGLVVVAAVHDRRVRIGLVVAVPIAAMVLALVGPQLARRFDRPQPDSRDVTRLATLSGHGRAALWSAALSEGSAHPVAGGGAGTWQSTAMRRTGDLSLPANAHSLELETFAELGAVGLAIVAALLVALGAPTLAGRRAEPAALAVVVVWALVSAVDWDWQIPAATAPALIAATAVAPPTRRLGRRASTSAAVVLTAAGIGCALHGLGAAALERGRPTRLLPWDARPWVKRDPAHACRTDPTAVAVIRARLACQRTPK